MSKLKVAFSLFILLLFLPHAVLGEVLDYSVLLKGIEDSTIYNECIQVSKTFQEKDDPPVSLFLLKQRAKSDLSRIRDILKAHAYYDAKVSFQVKERKEPQVVFEVSLGPIYPIKEIRVDILPGERELSEEKKPSPEEIGLQEGESAVAAKVRSAQSEIAVFFQRQGYVFVSQKKPLLEVDHSSQSVRVVFRVDPGPVGRYGETKVKGLQGVEESYVRNKIPWDRGEKYHPQDVAKLKKKLMATELFSLIQVNHPESLGDRGMLPMTVNLRERTPRSLGLGLGYETDMGIKARAYWEHRNFAGQGEKMRYSGDFSKYIQEVAGKYRVPEFLQYNQSLIFQASLKREDAEAYDSRGVETSVGIEREISPNLSWGSGISYKGVRLEDNFRSKNFHLLSLPSFLNWDSRDDPLNPSKGETINLKLTPFDKISEVSVMFLKSTLSVKKYIQLLWLTQPTLAWRGKLGSITPASAQDIPADELFYLGGGGSIRGYPYQEIGPEKNGDLYGGLSMLETSMELRQNISKSMGLVMFLDGGGAYEKRIPDVGKSFYWGAGVGFRYYTQVGPLRFDLAFPLDRENNKFRAYQIYLSVGQSF